MHAAGHGAPVPIEAEYPHSTPRTSAGDESTKELDIHANESEFGMYRL
jgi:hypothetical protein